MDEQRNNFLRDTFNIVSTGYDNRALRFFPESAARLAACLTFRGHERVLDVTTGTGHAALAVAPRVPRGKVIAIDFSPGMLDQARWNAAERNIRNVEFLERDMHDMGFPPASFDAAICAFGIFFAEDMNGQLTHIAEMVRPGGQVAVTTFHEEYFQPLRDLLMGRLGHYGVKLPPPAWKSVATEEGCAALFSRNGLTNVRVLKKNVGYYLDSADEWWDVVWNAGFRRLIGQLSAGDQQQFRREHLEEVSALRTGNGIWLDVGVFITVGHAS